MIRQWWYLSAFVLVLLTLSSCGKVTQEVASQDPENPKSFAITIAQEMYPTQNLTVPSADVLTNEDTELYAAVYGLTQGEFPELLSWGKGALVPEQPSSENAFLGLRSKAYNKSGVTIKKSNLNDAFLSLNTLKSDRHQWKVRSDKIRFGYSAYVVYLYASPSKYYGFYLDEKTASENIRIDKDGLDEYETFLTVLYMAYQNTTGFADLETLSYAKLASLYKQTIFETLDYSPAPADPKTFDRFKPEFDQQRPLEKTLIRIAELLVTGDKLDARHYVKETKDLPLSELSKEKILEAISGFEQPNSGVDEK